MVLRQLADGRSMVENQYSRVVREEGNPLALRAIAETMELRTTFEWRGLGFISQSALKLRAEYADWDAEVRFEIPGVRVADPKACQCGEVLKGVIKPWECKVFGTACTPDHPIGTCMVSSEGACAAYFNYGRHAGRRRRETAPTRVMDENGSRAARSEEEVLDAIEERRRRPRRKLLDERITLSHGAGREVEPRPGRGAVPAGAPQPAAGAARRQRRSSPARASDSPSPPTRSSSARCSSRAATSASSPSTGPSTTWRWRARGRVALSAGFIVEEGLPVADLERIVASMARAPPRPRACRSRPATPRSSSAARPTASTSTPPGVGAIEHDLELGPGSIQPGRPGDRVGPDRRPRDGDHDRPRRAGARGGARV